MKTIDVVEFQTSRFPHYNTNGNFALSKDGTLIFVYCRSMKPGSNVLCRTVSTNGGYSWSKPSVLRTFHNEDGICSSPSLLYLDDGTLLLFYTSFQSPFSAVNYISSKDNGNTWSTPQCCTNTPGYYIISNDHAFLTSSGRIILPISYHDYLTTPTSLITIANIDQIINQYGTVLFLISDDNGRTWTQNTQSLMLNEPSSTEGIQEPGIVEIKKGLLYGWARSDLGRQYDFFSFDNGVTWTMPEPSVFSSSCATAIIKRRSRDGLMVAIWNPIPNYISHDVDNINCRQELVYATSSDNGDTWSTPEIIENKPSCEFSHPALFFMDNYMVVSYNVTSGKQSHSFSLRIRIIYL